MKEGSFTIVMDLPKYWPPVQDVELFSRSFDYHSVSLSITPGGSFVIDLNDKELKSWRFVSQPIVFEGNGSIIVMANWSENGSELFLNNINIAPLDKSVDKKVVTALKRHPVSAIASVDRIDAVDHCRHWMEWRKSKYANPKLNAKKNRRLKSLGEQIEELKSAILSLSDILTLIHGGRDHLLGHLAVELRALLYWGGKNYNPLLLRVAGLMGLPLPVYALLPNLVSGSVIRNIARQNVRLNQASITMKFPRQELVDMQEWLQMPVQEAIIYRKVNGVSGDEKDILDAKKLILDSATALGAAHYDDDLPDNLELLYKTTVAGANTLKYFLIQTSLLTIELGKYVLNQAPSENC